MDDFGVASAIPGFDQRVKDFEQRVIKAYGDNNDDYNKNYINKLKQKIIIVLKINSNREATRALLIPRIVKCRSSTFTESFNSIAFTFTYTGGGGTSNSLAQSRRSDWIGEEESGN